MTVAYVSDGNINPALGTRGGLPGAASAQYRRRTDGSLENLPACAEVVIAPGETIVSISGGGGGYGHPYERDPERVLQDVREGWISRERAESVYRVHLTPDNVVDEVETNRLRARIRDQ
jgi:N-methylhydantoinase B